MFLNFLNFLLRGVYPNMAIHYEHYEQWIFIIYNSTGNQRNNFQQLETSFLELDTNNLADKCKIYFCSH